MMKRILCLLIAVLMLPFALMGCKSSKEKAEEGTSGSAPTEAATTNPYDVSDDLNNLKFGTKEQPVEFSVLQWDSYDPDWCINPEIKNTSIVGEELYQRQLYMEDRFGIVFKFTEVKGKYDSIEELNRRIEASVAAGSKAYDLAGHYSVGASLLVTSGYAYNLLDVKYLDLSKSYWPKDLLHANTVNGQMYFLSGYLAPSYFGNISCVFYNQEMIENQHYEDPVALVDSSEWTFEKLKQMSVGLYKDTLQDGIDRADEFGLVFNQSAAPIDALPVACGIRMMDVGADGRLQLSSTCYSTKGVGIINDLTNLVTQNPAIFIDTKSDGDFGSVFPSGRSLFVIDQFNSTAGYMEKASFDFGVVPLPKYDKDQPAYYSSVGPQFTMFTIPADAKNPDMTGAVLEALEAYSYRELFPVLYEENFKLKYSKDQNMSRMVTLIYESALLDPAKTWGDAAALYWVIRSSITGTGQSWSVKLRANRSSTWQTSIDDLNKYLFHEN